jgi:hypothetical protein
MRKASGTAFMADPLVVHKAVPAAIMGQGAELSFYRNGHARLRDQRLRSRHRLLEELGPFIVVDTEWKFLAYTESRKG